MKRPAGGFPKRFEDATFQPRVLELLFRACQAGWNIYTVGNEDDVARGRVSDEAWEQFHSDLLEHVKAQGITVTRDYACLDHPEGLPPHDKESVFMFPNTGAFYHAAQEDGIVLAECWLVSDDVPELAAAWRAGAHVAAVHAIGQRRADELQVEPELTARRAIEAIAEILSASPSIPR